MNTNVIELKQHPKYSVTYNNQLAILKYRLMSLKSDRFSVKFFQALAQNKQDIHFFIHALKVLGVHYE